MFVAIAPALAVDDAARRRPNETERPA